MNMIVPIEYAIELTPNLDTFHFQGRLELKLNALEPVKQVALNLKELAIWHCRLRLKEKRLPCAFEVDPASDSLLILLPQAVHRQFELEIAYEGLINDEMSGLYRTRFHSDGKTCYMAVTQFQESAARRVFPCMDHPSQKAVFKVTLIAEADLVALSNGTVVQEARLANDMKRVSFEATPLMSTYLLFVGLGAFEVQDSPGKVLVRGITPPGRGAYVAYGMDFGRRALEYCEEYFGIAYPLGKMDLIAVPDFAFGAMENWGAITFRENLLLYYPGVTSQQGEVRICEVIAHEVTHQWFGNLVSPSDWRYLWLNESFATYFGFGIVDHYHGDWGIWDQFLLGQTANALARDGLHETVAMEMPGGEQNAINAATAPIIYNKGASILRQIQGYIGSNHFRAGLRHYLNAHAYSCAASQDLWEAFEAAAQQPVTRMMQSWITQPGHPVVQVQRKGDQLHATQQRFTYLPGSFDQLWSIPLRVRFFAQDGSEATQTHLMDQKTLQIPIPPATAAYKLNDGQSGFYRVNYLQDGDWDALGQRVLDQTLAPEDRWGVQEDLFALVRGGQTSLKSYLNFVRSYDHEEHYLPLAGISAHLFEAYLVAPDSQQALVAESGIRMIEQALTHIGFEPVPSEVRTIAILRDQLLWLGVLLGSEPVTAFARRQFQMLVANQAVPPDIHKSVLQAGCWLGREDELAWLFERFQRSESEHDRLNVLAALGSFQQKDLLDKALAFTLGQVPDRNKFMPIVAAAFNPVAGSYLWRWYQAHLAELERFHPLLYERVIEVLVPFSGLYHQKEIVTFFKAYLEKGKVSEQLIRLALEKLEVNWQMRGTAV